MTKEELEAFLKAFTNEIPIRMVAPLGDDFGLKVYEVTAQYAIDADGCGMLLIMADHWQGRLLEDLTLPFADKRPPKSKLGDRK